MIRVDPSLRPSLLETIPVGDEPRSVAVGAGSVWVANIAGESVSEIDPESRQTVGRPIEAGKRPSELAVGGGSV